MYNESLLINNTNLAEDLVAINSMGEIAFIYVLLIVLWIIITIGVLRYSGTSIARSMTYSSFILSFLSTIVWGLDMLAGEYILIPAILTVAGIFYIIFVED